jgi:hypothetical protein
MSDTLFLKRLPGNWWLGVRLPKGLEIRQDETGLAVSSGWNYEETPWPPKIVDVQVPALAITDATAELAWRPIPIGGPAPAPFSVFATDVGEWEESTQRKFLELPDTEDPKPALGEKLGLLRKSATVPLRLMQAYRDLSPESFSELENGAPGPKALELLREASSGQRMAMTVELLSGLLFLARTEGTDPPEGADLLVDAALVRSVPEQLSVTAIQTARGATFRIHRGALLLTNANTADVIAGGPAVEPHVPYYRLTRSVGIEQRASKSTTLIAIPLGSKPPRQKDRELTIEEKQAWGQRPFQPEDLVDRSLVGELLNYQVELVNLHGRRTHMGRVMFARQPMDRPAPPTRGVGRLRMTPEGQPLDLQVWLDIPRSEVDGLAQPGSPSKPQLRSAEVAVYGLVERLVPTGFYGDADDAALAIGRMMSDLDPAALLTSGMAQFPTGGDDEYQPDPHAATAGLLPLDSHSLRHNVLPGPVSDASPAWSLQVGSPASVIPIEKGLRLFASLRRTHEPGSLHGTQTAPESALVPLALEIGVQRGEQLEIVATPQHLEQFWVHPPVRAPLGEGEARVVEIPVEGGTEVAPPAVIRVIVDHAGIVAQSNLSIGGYRLWVRDAAAPQHVFRDVAVVQAVPALVKAFAPVETGRLWQFLPAAGVAMAVPDVPAALDANTARDFLPVETITGETDAVEEELKGQAKGTNGTSMLALVRALAARGTATEYVLSIARRRQLERSPDAIFQLPGNWLLLRDQNGTWLGRAWRFWGPQATELPGRIVLQEQPNAQDTVGIDDFGRVAWNWHGLRDGWRHELEWVVEPLARNAAMLQRLKGDKGDRYSEKSAAAVLGGPRHRIVVQRRKPLDKAPMLGVVQRFDSAEDRFVFTVVAPPPFHQATHNALARTAHGVLAMRVVDSMCQFADADHFRAPDVPRALIEAWCGGPIEEKPARPLEVRADTGERPFRAELGELVIDQPACLSLDFALEPLADGVAGGLTRVQGARREPSVFRPAAEFEDTGLLRKDRARFDDQKTLLIPLARFEWFYGGPARPRLNLLESAPADLKDRSLLRLPDPFCDAIVYRLGEDNTFVQLARFRGRGLPKLESNAFEPIQLLSTPCEWGQLWAANGVNASLPVTQFGSTAGRVKLDFASDQDPSEFRIHWRRDSRLLMLVPFLKP